MTHKPPPYLLVVSLEPLDASTTLFFGHLQNWAPDSIRIVRFGEWGVADALSGATAVVFVRGLFEFGSLSRCAQALGIPMFYFVDDNFIVLRDQGGLSAKFVERYTTANVSKALGSFAGALLATPALAAYYIENGLCANPELLTPTISPKALARPATRDASRMRVAFFGGHHLHESFRRDVLPAIRRLAREQPMRLITIGMAGGVPESPGLEVVHHPYFESYAAGVQQLASEQVDVLVHPSTDGVPNNAYKNPHALITANALRAVPIVSDREPYDHLSEAGVALLCLDTEESWFEALRQSGSDRFGANLRARLAEYCERHFGAEQNLKVVSGILSRYPQPSALDRLRRNMIAHAYLMNDLAARARLRVKLAMA